MQPNAALGISAQFPQAQFENAIRFAMQMGAPNDPAKRATFFFPSPGKAYFRDGAPVADPRVDRDGKPLDPNIEVRSAPPVTKQVDCAIEVEGGGSNQTAVGNFPAVRLVITLLEAEWAQVVGCDGVEYNGDRFLYDHEPENYGLFGANVHTMIFIAEDET